MSTESNGSFITSEDGQKATPELKVSAFEALRRGNWDDWLAQLHDLPLTDEERVCVLLEVASGQGNLDDVQLGLWRGVLVRELYKTRRAAVPEMLRYLKGEATALRQMEWLDAISFRILMADALSHAPHVVKPAVADICSVVEGEPENVGDIEMWGIRVAAFRCLTVVDRATAKRLARKVAKDPKQLWPLRRFALWVRYPLLGWFADPSFSLFSLACVAVIAGIILLVISSGGASTVMGAGLVIVGLVAVCLSWLGCMWLFKPRWWGINVIDRPFFRHVYRFLWDTIKGPGGPG